MRFSPHDEDRIWKDPKHDGWFRSPSPLHYIILVIVLALLAAGLWVLFSPLRQAYEPSELPVVHADETPFKVRADDQGVPSIKHQDKLVYERISGETNSSHVEHILPDPEKPMVQFKETQPIQMIEQILSEGEKRETDQSHSSIEDLIEVLPKEQPAQEKQAKTGTIFIQLGSLKSYDMAEAEWKRISKKHQDILGGYDPFIQKVDLGAKQGIYYRLRTGPFESQVSAKKVCEILKEKKGECVVIP